MGDFGKIVSGIAGDLKGGLGNIPVKINTKATSAGVKAGALATKYGASEETKDLMSKAIYNGTKFGVYGAAGAGTIGAVVGVARQDTTVGGGAIGGAGLGAIGGAGAGAVAAAIAKSIR